MANDGADEQYAEKYEETTRLPALEGLVLGTAGKEIVAHARSTFGDHSQQVQLIVELVRQMHENRISIHAVESEIESSFENRVAVQYKSLMAKEHEEIRASSDRAASASSGGTGRADAQGQGADGKKELSEWEKNAALIAEKVQRQQEGLESAMLSDEHKDDAFETIEDIEKLLEEQWTGQKMSSERKKRLSEWFLQRSKYIPLRLKYEERKYLRLVQAVMQGVDYTDVVDGRAYKTPQKRYLAIQRALSAVFTGILTACKMEWGRKVISSRDFQQHESAFQFVFELTRRYKIMNPEKMREIYGKLLYLLQDCRDPHVVETFGFDAVSPVSTVYDVLQKEPGALDMLSNKYIVTATREILPDGKSRAQIQREIAQKEKAKKLLIRTYSIGRITEDEIELCLNSICDNNNFLNSNRKPIDRMLQYLHKFFTPGKETAASSLAIEAGSGETRLTHSHERQFKYVLQTLTLWREIVNDLFRLWYLAEEDLLDKEIHYSMRDTGQGVNRLQACNRISKAIHGILYAVQQRSTGEDEEGWVGSSVIHLGDDNVPNALAFIDKYNQVSRILNPIDQCLRHIDLHSSNDKEIRDMLREGWGGPDGAKMAILRSFFREGFDGSGGETFFSAGSCVDGRLTSAWNWCQRLPAKDFFVLFRLAGFTSFNGEF
eukprot:g4288.t1